MRSTTSRADGATMTCAQAAARTTSTLRAACALAATALAFTAPAAVADDVTSGYESAPPTTTTPAETSGYDSPPPTTVSPETSGYDSSPPTASGCAGADALPESTPLEALRGSVVCLLRAERRRLGAGAVALDTRLARAAHRHTAAMVREGFFAHVAPDGDRLADRLAWARWIPRAGSWDAGEILACGSSRGGTPRAFVRAWIASPTHRAVLRRRAFTQLGVGLVRGTPKDAGQGVTATVEFGRR